MARTWSPASTVSATISHAIESMVYFAVVLTTASANVANAVANPDGKVTIVRAKYQSIRVCHRMAAKFARAMAIVIVDGASAKRQLRVATRESIVKNVQRVRDGAKSLRNAFNVKSTKPDQWEIIQICAPPIARCSYRKASRNWK